MAKTHCLICGNGIVWVDLPVDRVAGWSHWPDPGTDDILDHDPEPA